MLHAETISGADVSFVVDHSPLPRTLTVHPLASHKSVQLEQLAFSPPPITFLQRLGDLSFGSFPPAACPPRNPTHRPSRPQCDDSASHLSTAPAAAARHRGGCGRWICCCRPCLQQASPAPIAPIVYRFLLLGGIWLPAHCDAGADLMTFLPAQSVRP